MDAAAEPARDQRWRELTKLVARLQSDLDLEREQRTASSVAELAKGILVERLHCSPTEAAKQLAWLAGQLGVSVPELALDVIDQAANDDLTRSALATPQRRRARLAHAEAQAASDGDDVAAAVFGQVLAPLGASSVAVWQLGPDGGLDLVGQAGLSPLDTSRWRRIPPQMDSLGQRVLADGSALWWPAGAPHGTRVPVAGSRGGGRAVLPLVESGAHVGVMEVCWAEPVGPAGATEAFPAGLRHQLLAAAQVCVQALALHGDRSWEYAASWLPALLDGLTDSVLLAHALRNEAGDLVDFRVDHVTERFVDPAGRGRDGLLGRTFLALYPLAAGPGGLYERLVQVFGTGESFHAEHFLLRVLVGGAETAVDVGVRVTKLFDGIAIGWQVADETGRLGALLEHAEKMGQLGGWEQDLLTGDVLWTDNAYAVFHLTRPDPPIRLEELDSHVHPDDVEAVQLFRDALLTLARPAATAFRLARSDGAVRNIRAFGETVTASDGTPIAVRGAYQDLSAAYGAQVALAATRDRLAESEQLAEDRQRLALRLQQAIIATSARLPRTVGLDIAVRYRPAEQEHLVSGDWYSAVNLPTGDVLLVVGDIAGHGIEAVTAMVNLRYSLKGLAVTGAGPGQLLTYLNTITYHLTDNVTGTAICGRYDPASRTLRWSRAGHLPPVLVRDGRARSLPLPNGILLGVTPDAEYEESLIVLEPGDRILLFTDGLVERRGTSMDETLEALLRLAERPAPDIEAYADHLLAKTTPDTADDTCLIAVHVR